MDSSLIFQKKNFDILQLDPSLQPATLGEILQSGLIKQTPEPCFFFRFYPAVYLLDHSGHRLCKDQTLQHWTLGAKKIRSSSRLGCDIFFTPTPKKTQKNNELLEAEAN